MSFFDFFAFKRKIQIGDNPSEVINELNDLREKVNKTYYLNLNNQNREIFLNFLWKDLHSLWIKGSSQIKLASSSTIGQILLYLAPFFSEELMRSLMKEIKEFNTHSLLYVACFNYLSKFFYQFQIEDFLAELQIIPLISLSDAENIPKLTMDLLHMPQDFLFSLVTYFMGLLIDDPANEYIAEAAHIIITQNPQPYASIISMKTPLQIISKVFGNKFPIFDSSLVTHLKKKTLKIIQNFKSSVNDYSSACKILGALISNEQINFNVVYGIFTVDSIKLVPSIHDLLTLPIEPSIVYSLYGNQKYTEKKIDIDSGNFEDVFHVDSNDQPDEIDGDGNNVVLKPPGSPMKNLSYLPALPLSESPIKHRKKTTQLDPFHIDNNKEIDSPMIIGINENIIKQENDNSGISPLSPYFEDLPSVEINIDDIDYNLSLDKKTNASHKPLQSRKRYNSTNQQKIASYELSNSLPNFGTDFPIPKPILIEEYASFISSTSNLDILSLDDSFIVPLMEYFKRYPEYENELCNLILHAITGNEYLLLSAIDIISTTHHNISNDNLNCILFELFNLKDMSINVRQKMLHLIGCINLSQLKRIIADKLIKFLDDSSISKVACLKKGARKSMVNLYQHIPLNLFKFIFDMILQKIDVFDEYLFEQRLSFIAYVIKKIDGNWFLSFIHIISYLIETLSIFTFNKRIMQDFFIIMSKFAPYVTDKQILTVLIHHAVNTLENIYQLYTGENLFLIASPFFANDIKINVTLNNVDSDLIMNPCMWHTFLLKSGKTAFSFLSAIHWTSLDLTPEDIQFALFLIRPLASLFPFHLSNYIISLFDIKAFQPSILKDSIGLLIRNSYRSKDMLSTVQLITALSECIISLDIFKSLYFIHLAKDIHKIIIRFKNLSYHQVLSLKNFFILSNMKCDESVFETIIDPKYIDNLKYNEPLDENQLIDEKEIDENITEDTILEFDSQLNEDDALGQLIVSLTPLIYSNLDISGEILTENKIISFCVNSNSSIDANQCQQLFLHALNKLSSRSLFYILRYAQRNRFNLGIERYLDHPLINTRRLFQSVLMNLTLGKNGISDFSTEVVKYIKSFINEDLTDFILNAQPLDRKNSIIFLRFDPKYFLERIRNIPNFHSYQLCNLCIYIQNVKFPRDEFINFAFELVFRYINSRKKKNLTRRILSISIFSYGLSNSNPKINKSINLLMNQNFARHHSNITNKSLIQNNSAADFVENVYSLMIISKYINCKELIDQMLIIIYPSTIYHYHIKFIYQRLKTLEIKGLEGLIHPSLVAFQISIETEIMRKNQNYTPSIEFIKNINSILTVRTVMTDECMIKFRFLFENRSHNVKVGKLIIQSIANDIQRAPMMASISKHIFIFKSITMNPIYKSGSLREILKIISVLLNTSIFPAGFIETYSLIMIRMGKVELFKQVMNEHFRRFQSYYSVYYGEVTANIFIQFNMTALSSPNGTIQPNKLNLINKSRVCNYEESQSNILDVCNILPDIQDFYSIFNAIVVIEKKHKSISLINFMKKLSGAQLLAIQALTDPKYRIFSPLFALFPDNANVPVELSQYMVKVQNNIQVNRITDSYHEF
ncbi:hypothetical protein TRFO_04018 [Tritrichomonas foetus]|uniref:Uncharacterized protein n=1 Tax=Tritrichomonas foetus TaxID=1144522 RepID=A0A1J4KJ19_9EUKA|nr:hypothetical protein TRFO_04018 [Tritrichomonas foetus]|eukprot:OHT11082.1 hypothetical protein TRFO_04018 [Tritrichomonas foetus]